jgi:hypothetical protein
MILKSILTVVGIYLILLTNIKESISMIDKEDEGLF